MKSSRFHEIREIRWISPMKSSGFHEIWQISWNPWNPADFTLKSGRFHEICWISWNPWNLVDFTHEIWWISPRYYLWNPPKIIKASVSAKTLQFDECRVGDFTLEIHQISPWNLVDFTCEIWQISPWFHLWNPPKIIKASVSAKTLQFDECRVGDFTLEIQWISSWNLVDFNHEIWWISPMKSTQNYKSKCFSKNSSVWWMQDGGYDQGFHEICWISHEIHWISKLWAFAWWSSIGLLYFKRPIRRVFAETSDFIRFGVDFTWNPPDFMQISWNLADFMWNQKTSCKEL